MKKVIFFIVWLLLLPVILATSKSGVKFELRTGIHSLIS